jgi:SAM-dependent methyltransferase
MYEAEDTHWWYQGLRGVMLTLLGLRRGNGRRLRILDAGCGTGGNIHALRQAGYSDVDGFDFSPMALHFCRRRGLESVRQGSIMDMPYGEGSYDIIISCDVLNDAGTEDEVTALRELYRVLKPGGRLFLNLPAFSFLRSEHDRATSVARRYTKGDISRKLVRAGFRVKRVTYWNMLLFPAVVLVRVLRRERPDDLNKPARSDIVLPPTVINILLTGLLKVEGLLLRRVNLPFGSSVAVVAVKPR